MSMLIVTVESQVRHDPLSSPSHVALSFRNVAGGIGSAVYFQRVTVLDGELAVPCT